MFLFLNPPFKPQLVSLPDSSHHPSACVFAIAAFRQGFHFSLYGGALPLLHPSAWSDSPWGNEPYADELRDIVSRA